MSKIDQEINNQCHIKCPNCNYQTLFNPLYATNERGFCENGVWKNDMGNFKTLSYMADHVTKKIVWTFQCPSCANNFSK